MNTNRIFFIAAIISMLACFLVIITIIYWLVYPYKILEFGPDNGKLLQTTVKSGDYLEMQQDFCKYKNLISQVDRQFINSIVYQVPVSYNSRPLGCHKKSEFIYVPKALRPGEYHINTTITFYPNPIRKITKVVRTGKFTVTE